jgi:hypothetical protein
MKPIRNRFICEDCGRVKMLFETKKKADTFMEFNGVEIAEETGYKPERSYYCAYCGGWHVTSNKEQLDIKSRTEKILDSYKHEKKQKTASKVKKRIQTKEEIQKSVFQAHKKELERELEAYTIPLREQAALKNAQAIEKKKQQKEQAALEKEQAKEQRKKQREQAALEKAQVVKQKKQVILEKVQAIEQKKKQKEQQAPILAKKAIELKSILHYAESYIGMVERLTFKNFTPNSVRLLDRVSEELEKAKSIGISYKKSEKRIARIKQRADILRNKYKTK